ncbi:hypothetical protein KFK09_021542 [Dendrobium nobile]|uniref:Reverse transcriptase domain-containing protein n=1 Tax=Dendrobium nobile TaxID=94219 RepID=A0A8T3AQD4_DENNO|nr:hypothetical protein KFK09_021542 [Dendrobium nobile]
MTKGAKATAITLIPKHSHANSISDYRPISLCNVFYKVVAKLLANRLKKVLPYIIHESQGGFIKDRSASDNIILASEILRDFNNSNNYFCAKLDIHKRLTLFPEISSSAVSRTKVLLINSLVGLKLHL